jgi:hypothetical protein
MAPMVAFLCQSLLVTMLRELLRDVLHPCIYGAPSQQMQLYK